MKPILLLLAASMGNHYGGLEQLDGLGPNEETVMDYFIYDAVKTGLGRIIFVIREDFEDESRKEVLSEYVGHIPTEVCFQSIDKLPEGFIVPEGREKPWGISHAVTVAEGLISKPFCVVNRDDFHSRDAFTIMGKFLTNLPEGLKNNYAMVGFRVGNTLSESGTMARGTYGEDGQGNLTTVVERIEAIRVNETVYYEDKQGGQVAANDNTPVSVNTWDLTPDYFRYSDAYSREFLFSLKNMENLKAEFLIPLMVNRLTQEGAATMKVLDTASRWFGVTYATDRQDTVDRIQSPVDQDVYPNQLS